MKSKTLTYFKLACLFSFYFLCAYIPSIAQVSGSVLQKGLVRTQNFLGRQGSPVDSAIITLSGTKGNAAYSGKDGRFCISVDKEKTFCVSSVTLLNGRKDLKVMEPLPSDKRQYTDKTDLVIVMTSEKEQNEFVRTKMEEERNSQDIKFRKYKEEQKKLFNEKQIELDTLMNRVAEYEKMMTNNLKLFEYIIKNQSKKDFNDTDSICNALEEALTKGDYAKFDEIYESTGTPEGKALEISYWGKMEKIASESKKNAIEHSLRVEEEKLKKDLKLMNYDGVKKDYQNILRYDSTNVEYICQWGYLEETYYSNYHCADSLYKQALLIAQLRKIDNPETLATIHNHLGDICYLLVELEKAQEHYEESIRILTEAGQSKSSEIYTAYVGMGKIKKMYGKFDQAEKYFRKVIDVNVAEINKRAHIVGRISLANIDINLNNFQQALYSLVSLKREIENDPDIKLEELGDLYSDMIDCLYLKGDYTEAFEIGNEALLYINSHSSGYNYHKAAVLISQARALNGLGRIQESKINLDSALVITNKVLGDKHPYIALVLQSLGDYYIETGEFDLAKNMLLRSISLIESKFGTNKLNSASALYSLLSYYYQVDDRLNARETLNQIRIIYKKENIDNILWHNQLNVYEAYLNVRDGNIKTAKKAKDVLEEAIAIHKKALGEDSPTIITLYKRLSQFATSVDEYKEYIEKAKKLARKIFGSNSYQFKMIELEETNLYLSLGEHKKVESILNDVEHIFINRYGADNYQMNELFQKMGDFYLDKQEYNNAEAIFRRQYNVMTQTFGERSYPVVQSLLSLGMLYGQLGYNQKAMDMFVQADSIICERFGQNSFNRIPIRLAVCNGMINMKKIDEALELFQSLKSSITNQVSKNHTIYLQALSTESKIYQAMGDLPKAINCMQKSFDLYQQQIERNLTSPLLLTYYGELSQLYMLSGQWKQATQLNENALQTAKRLYGDNAIPTMRILMQKADLLRNRPDCPDCYELAQKIYLDVHEAFEKKYGPDAIEMYSIALRMAEMEVSKGQVENAIMRLVSLRDKLKEKYGKDFWPLISVYTALGSTYRMKMQFPEGETMYKEALDLAEKFHGKNSPELINILTEYSQCSYGKPNKYLLDRALSIACSAYGRKHLLTLQLEAKIGTLKLSDNMAEAKSIFDRYYQAAENAVKKNKVHVSGLIEPLQYLAQYHKLQAQLAYNNAVIMKQNLDKALEYLNRICVIIRDTYGQDTPMQLPALSEIIDIYTGMGKLDSLASSINQYLNISLVSYGENSYQVAYGYRLQARLLFWTFYDNGLIEEEKAKMVEEKYQQAIGIFNRLYNRDTKNRIFFTWQLQIEIAQIKSILNKKEEAMDILDRTIKEVLSLDEDSRIFPYYELLKNKIEFMKHLEKGYAELNPYVKEICRIAQSPQLSSDPQVKAFIQELKGNR